MLLFFTTPQYAMPGKVSEKPKVIISAAITCLEVLALSSNLQSNFRSFIR
jgi:hypothetical protein